MGGQAPPAAASHLPALSPPHVTVSRHQTPPPTPSLLPTPQVFILYFKPSIFRCIVLRWVRMLGFATVYGTIALKLYR